MMRVIKAFLPAVIVAYLLASILFTQTILATVQSFGLEVSFAQRLGATWHDILGMASSYLLLLLVAFLIALPAGATLYSRRVSRRGGVARHYEGSAGHFRYRGDTHPRRADRSGAGRCAGWICLPSTEPHSGLRTTASRWDDLAYIQQRVSAAEKDAGKIPWLYGLFFLHFGLVSRQIDKEKYWVGFIRIPTRVFVWLFELSLTPDEGEG